MFICIRECIIRAQTRNNMATIKSNGVIYTSEDFNPLRTKTVGIRQNCRIPPYIILNLVLKGLMSRLILVNY